MKRFIKNNLKAVIAFISGAIMFSGITYAATFSFASGDVEHTKSDGSKTNVKAALNDLYVKASQGNASASQILSGKKALSNGTLLTGTMANNGPLNWNPTTSATYQVPAGYYSGGTLNSSGAFNQGYTQGLSECSSSTPSVNITYTIGHKHVGNKYGGGCYTVDAGTEPVYGNHLFQWDNGAADYVCRYCGTHLGALVGWDNDQYETAAGDAARFNQETCGSHIENSRHIYNLGCGKSDGQVWTSNNASNLAQGDYVISATISY